MKRLLYVLLLAPLLALAGPNDIVTTQRNATDTGSIPRTVAKPPGTQDGVMAFSGATQLPVHWAIGPGLIVSGGVLDAVPGGPVSWASISGKPTFSTVAISGLYSDLTGLPTLFSGAYSALTGIPSTFAPSAHTHAASDIVSGVLAVARIPSLAISQTTGLQAALDAKFNIPAGTALQYVRGDGALATLPVAKRVETYSGTTNASGQITVTYSTAFPAVPVVQPPAPAAANQVWTTVSSTTTGFTLQLSQRNVVTLLSVEVLLGATVPVSGTAATFLVVAQ